MMPALCCDERQRELAVEVAGQAELAIALAAFTHANKSRGTRLLLAPTTAQYDCRVQGIRSLADSTSRAVAMKARSGGGGCRRPG